MEIQLGSLVRDRISGQEGIAASRTVYLYGNARIGILPQESKDGKPAEVFWIDEPQVEVGWNTAAEAPR
jgi:hypothetical protein